MDMANFAKVIVPAGLLLGSVLMGCSPAPERPETDPPAEDQEEGPRLNPSLPESPKSDRAKDSEKGEGDHEAVSLSEVTGAPSDYPAPAIADSEIRCMALALYHEARAEPDAGLWAVGHVILNRMEAARYPDTACGVTKDGGSDPPCQFSWWCDSLPDTPREADAWENARVLARKLLLGEIEDPTNGATSFHAKRVSPYWAEKMTRTVTLGNHHFYRIRRN